MAGALYITTTAPIKNDIIYYIALDKIDRIY